MLTDRELQKYRIIQSEEYSSPNYQIKFTAFAEGFLFIDFKGSASNEDIHNGFEIKKRIIKNAGFDKREYFEIWDYVYYPKTNREGRLLISDYLSEPNPTLVSIIYTNCSLQQKITLRTGFSFITNKHTIHTIKNSNSIAIDFGLKLLNSKSEERAAIIDKEIQEGSLTRNYSINNFYDLWSQNRKSLELFHHDYPIITNDDWKIQGKGFNAVISVTDSDIFIITCEGKITKEYFEQIFKIKNQIINLLGLNKATIYQIFDFAKVSLRSLIREIKTLNELLLLPVELNNTTILVSNKKNEFFLYLKNKLSNKKWLIKNSFENAFHHALLIKEYFTLTSDKDLIIPKKASDKKLLITLLHDKIQRLNKTHHQEIESIIKMLSQLAWDKYQQPIQMGKTSSEQLENVYYAIKLIFEDNLDILKQYQNNLHNLEEANQKLAKQQTLKDASDSAQNTSKEKYKSIFNNLIDVYFEITLNGIILEISPSIEKIIDKKREDIIGTSIFQYIVSSKNIKQAFRSLLNNQEILNLQIELTDKTLNYSTCSINAKLNKNDNAFNRSTITGMIREVAKKPLVNKEVKIGNENYSEN